MQKLDLHRYSKGKLPTFQEYIAQMNMFMILLNKEDSNQFDDDDDGDVDVVKAIEVEVEVQVDDDDDDEDDDDDDDDDLNVGDAKNASLTSIKSLEELKQEAHDMLSE